MYKPNKIKRLKENEDLEEIKQILEEKNIISRKELNQRIKQRRKNNETIRN